MATAILISLSAVTVAFLVWDLVTRARHRRQRGYAAFALLAVPSPWPLVPWAALSILAIWLVVCLVDWLGGARDAGHMTAALTRFADSPPPDRPVGA
jgi:hypothetical protein